MAEEGTESCDGLNSETATVMQLKLSPEEYEYRSLDDLDKFSKTMGLALLYLLIRVVF